MMLQKKGYTMARKKELTRDEYFMKEAIRQAKKAEKLDMQVIVRDVISISRGLENIM